MTCLTTAATPLVHSVDPTTGIVFGTFLGFSSAALLIIGESARRTVGIVYLNENKDKVNFHSFIQKTVQKTVGQKM